MAGKLQNEIVVVTGGADGIGYSICDKYLEQGSKTVIIIDNNETCGNEAVKTLTTKHGECKSIFIKGDVTTDLEKIFKIIMDTYKRVDVLVLAAGIYIDKPIRIIDINLTAVIEWSLKFEEIMRNDDSKGNGGTIILISSILGFRAEPYFPVYQASKFGVLGFAKSMGHLSNYKNNGVRVIALCPGYTKTKPVKTLSSVKRRRTLSNDLVSYLDQQLWQEPDAVGNAAVEVFKRAESGTVWVIEGGKLTQEY